MIHWFRFIVRLVPASYAFWRSRGTPLFFLYFVAQTGDIVSEEAVFQTFGDSGPAYFWTYTIGSALICLFALWIALDAIPGPRRLRKAAIPLVLAVTVARMVAVGCGGSPDALLLAVGACMFFCGQVTSAAASYAYRNHTPLLILGLLWLAQAMYFFGYLIHAPEWVATGYWLPALLACLGFLGVGLTVPRHRADR